MPVMARAMPSSRPIPRPVAWSPLGRWSVAVAMPGAVVRPATNLLVAARCVPPCLTLRYHAKLVMADARECPHK
eukprot:7473912-Alexandrium_andersonii.AAC.1